MKVGNDRLNFIYNIIYNILYTIIYNIIYNIYTIYIQYYIQYFIYNFIYNRLNFLDITLIIDNKKIIFDTYHKTTFSGRFLNFHSNHLLCYKRGIIITFVDKIFLLLHPRFQHNLVEAIHIFLNNGYPLPFIFSTIENRLKFHIHNKHTTQSTNQRKIFYSFLNLSSKVSHPTCFIVN